jgi:hypothetical protein
MFRFDRAPDEGAVFEAAKDTMHCLPADKRSASQFGVRHSRSLVEQFEA